MWLFIAFLAIPLIEITLFIQIGGVIGLGWTLVTVVLTAVLGAYLVRNQGLLAMNQLRSSMNDLRDPTEPLAHGAMILFSGALLLTPGFFTDAIGFSLLIPGVRHAVFNFLRSRVQVQSFGTTAHAARERDPASDIIDADYEEVETDKVRPSRPSGWTKH